MFNKSFQTKLKDSCEEIIYPEEIVFPMLRKKTSENYKKNSPGNLSDKLDIAVTKISNPESIYALSKKPF